ncbi:hypothetical protein HYH03_011631 [Edaphochlamys debaryana]|uniref:Uncharacterized protein n=1 Tax=Edaphochlamys debaryana TaxID=47281 RepID=A0A835XT77_9CHLO|nr:hypothetical protein HYH03_011631 [Edaphochlamys debaryana]|eukprot:KAG2489828.1 hypothetical protein HYH03_011631 [Edaphochlamys debaryana]
MSPTLRSALCLGVVLATLASGPIGATAARLGAGSSLQGQTAEVSVGDVGYAGYFTRQLKEVCSFDCDKWDGLGVGAGMQRLATCVTAACTAYNSTHNYVLVSMGSCKPGTVSPPPPPPPCGNDTIWAAPRTPGEAPPATNITAYKFTTSAPALVAQSSPIIFTWQPIQKLVPSEVKWGGYFTIPPPTASATTYTTSSPSPLGCAGCAKNDPRRGWDVGSVVLQVTSVNSTYFTASCAMAISNNPNKTVVVDSGHFYSSFAPLTSFAPGLFPTATIATITGIPPGSEGTTVTMSQKVGGTKPSSNPLIYLACHFTVSAC